MLRKTRDLTPYKNVLPYDSEIFGVYQPLIGWRSRRIWSRVLSGFNEDRSRILSQLLRNVSPIADIRQATGGRAGRGEGPAVSVKSIRTGEIGRSMPMTGSFLVDELRKQLPAEGEATDDTLKRLLDERTIDRLLDGSVRQRIAELQHSAEFHAFASRNGGADATVIRQVAQESRVARYLVDTAKAGQASALKDLLYGKANASLAHLERIAGLQDSLDMIDPHHDLGRVTLSPISIVHLFRQYFFEFDTFLGTPVGHVWLSPGSSVELVEIQTRRTLTEQSVETELTTTVKSETETTDQDEISESVKEDNKDTQAFGFNTSVHQGWIGGSADASASVNLQSTQEKARETTHKHMRQQTERLSTEIRQNYKTTFKTTSEVTDTSSKRYVLNNTTDKLINYELRRKMRQVGVQVQDIGTYLCWQTFVDNPGHQLGVSQLVHLAKSPETATIQPPESVPMPEPYAMKSQLTIPFVPIGSDTNEDDMDETYRNGVEVDDDFNEGELERVRSTFSFKARCDKANYVFDKTASSIVVDVGAADMVVKVRDITSNGAEVAFTVDVVQVNFQNQPSIVIEATTYWQPDQSIVDKVNAENKKNVERFNAETRREFEKAYVDAARERIKLASGIAPRGFDDLREEERIVVYRMLIQDMLTQDLPLKDDRTRHAVAELLNSIFDVDKMLYFVAPEWWKPRLHYSQVLGKPEKPDPLPVPSAGGGGVNLKAQSMHAFGTSLDTGALKGALGAAVSATAPLDAPGATVLAPENIVGWGGQGRRDNYYITEESLPAKLGSSLGWLLQLDGDNQRNAFLNAPWVKAVIPIRPGKERAAMNWLQRMQVEGADGLDAAYAAPAAELAQIPHSGSTVTLLDAIHHLCDVVAKKHEDSNTVGLYPPEETNDDNKVSATPVDRVYEHGFYPNQGSFKLLADKPFDVFDQWIEILPTDQVVPVEVQYDPITGRQLQVLQGDS